MADCPGSHLGREIQIGAIRREKGIRFSSDYAISPCFSLDIVPTHVWGVRKFQSKVDLHLGC